MKILFFAAVVLLIPFYGLLSFFFLLSGALGGFPGVLGRIDDALSVAGMYTIFVGLAGLGLGVFFFLKKKRMRRVVLCMSAGLIYALALLLAMLALDVVHSIALEKRFDEQARSLYGENWDAPSRVEHLPAHYKTVLDKLYVVAGEGWDEQALLDTDLYVSSMPAYYGSGGAEQIGFALLDIDCDGSDELLIGTTCAQGGTVIFSAYTDPDNPYAVLTSAEGEIYYLHDGGEGLYLAEIAGTQEDGTPHTGMWLIRQGTPERGFDAEYSSVQPDASGRLTIDMTPFSQYR